MNPDSAEIQQAHSQIHDSAIICEIPLVKYPVTIRTLKYGAFLICGSANMWPWNCFLTASEYFSSRLGDSHWLSANYSSSMMTVWTLTSTLYNLYIARKQKNVNYTYRLKVGCMIEVLVFLTMTCGMIIPRSWPTLNFVFIMLNVLASAIGACLMQVSLIALANIQGQIYASANVIGNAVSGVLPSVSMIVAVMTNTDQSQAGRTTQGVKYFLTSTAVALVALVSVKITEKADSDTYVEESDTQTSFITFSDLWKPLQFIWITIALVFSITLAFPIFAGTVQSPVVDKKVFIPLAFLVWNVGDLLGRVVCSWKSFVIDNQQAMVAYSISRVAFIPFFLGCNVNGLGEGWINDYFYILLQLLFGFTNGHLFSSAFMKIGQVLVVDDQKKAAGGYTTLVINFSLLAGSLVSYVLVRLISTS